MSNENNFLDSRRGVVYILISALILMAIFALSNSRVHFHDTPEYITLAKSFVGMNHTGLYITHSLVYPFILGLFLKIWPSLLMLKLINIIWMLLIFLCFLFFAKNEKVLWLWLFSPLVWFILPQISPIIPASFFIILGYFLIKRYEETKKKTTLFLAGLALGAALAIYLASLVLIFIILFVFFYKKRLNELITLLIGVLVTFSSELMLDWVIFGSPFYTLIRTLSANMIVALSLHPDQNQTGMFELISYFPSLYIWLILLVVIAPITFYILKIDLKKYNREACILLLAFAFYFFRTAMLKYLFLFSPLLILLLADTVKSWKAIIINCLISVGVILLLITPFYYQSDDYFLNGKDDFSKQLDVSVIEDLDKIHNQDFKDVIEFVAVSPLYLDMLKWDDSAVRYIWYEEYLMAQNNQTVFRDYDLKIATPKEYYNDLILEGHLVRNNNETFDEVNYAISKKQDIPEGFRPVKYYQVLVVSEKTK